MKMAPVKPAHVIPLGVTPFKFSGDIWNQKLESQGYSVVLFA